jgi:hypothetical protein
MIGRLFAPVQLEINFRLPKETEDFLNKLLFKNLSDMILLHYLVRGGSVISSLIMCVCVYDNHKAFCENLVPVLPYLTIKTLAKTYL